LLLNPLVTGTIELPDARKASYDSHNTGDDIAMSTGDYVTGNVVITETGKTGTFQSQTHLMTEDMNEIRIFNVIDKSPLAEKKLDRLPEVGDPVEIDREMYYVCEVTVDSDGSCDTIGVIPLMVRNPRQIKNIKSYLKCLSAARRRVQFLNRQNDCDFENCDEMVIS
jgi:hypothetical protein